MKMMKGGGLMSGGSKDHDFKLDHTLYSISQVLAVLSELKARGCLVSAVGIVGRLTKESETAGYTIEDVEKAYNEEKDDFIKHAEDLKEHEPNAYEEIRQIHEYINMDIGLTIRDAFRFLTDCRTSVEKIRELYKDSGYTYRELSEIAKKKGLDISYTTISEHLSEKKGISEKSLQIYAEIFGVSPDILRNPRIDNKTLNDIEFMMQEREKKRAQASIDPKSLIERNLAIDEPLVFPFLQYIKQMGYKVSYKLTPKT